MAIDRYTHPWFMSVLGAELGTRTIYPSKRRKESAAFCRLCSQPMDYPPTHEIVVANEEWIVHPDTPPSDQYELTTYGVGTKCLKRVKGLEKFLKPKWGEEVPSDPEAPLTVRLLRVRRRAERWLAEAEEAREALRDYLRLGYTNEQEAVKAFSDIKLPDLLDEYLLARTRGSAARYVLRSMSRGSTGEAQSEKLRALRNDFEQNQARQIVASTRSNDSPAERAMTDSDVTGLSDAVGYLKGEGF